MSAHVSRSLLVIALLLNGVVIAEPPGSPISKSLAIQDALRRGRELLQSGQSLQAIDLLEEQLPFINGNVQFLGLLRDAYGEAIKKLQLEHKEDQAADLQKRAQILQRGERSEIVRGVPPDSAPCPTGQSKVGGSLDELLAAADKAFAEKRYSEANKLFASALEQCPCVAQSRGGPWAYCKLNCVHERLTRESDSLDAGKIADCELEIAAALGMASADSKLTSFGKQLQDEVRRRKGPSAAVQVQVEIKHSERGADGWSRAETSNFRLFHSQSRERAEQIVRAAENARATSIMKWMGESKGAWNPVCDLYLHANAADYARETGNNDTTPGHATYQLQGGKVVKRRLDLRADEPNLLTNTLPHETTHLVLGELFADVPLPRWADEGMAVLAEPRSQIERFGRTLHRCRAQGELVHLAQLMQKSDYPPASAITAFYVESVSIVEFLVAERDAKTFVQFVRDTQRGSIDAALRKNYQCPTVSELEARWLRKLFPAEITRASSNP